MRFRFGLISMMIVLVVAGLFFRLEAPRWQFKRLLNGESDIRLREFMVTGQRRQVICRDPEVLCYFSQALPNAARAGDWDTAACSLLYRFHFTLSSGTYVIENSSLSPNALCMFIPFEPKRFEYGWPNRRLEFHEEAPKNWRRIVTFLLEEGNVHQTLTCDERGEITIVGTSGKQGEIAETSHAVHSSS